LNPAFGSLHSYRTPTIRWLSAQRHSSTRSSFSPALLRDSVRVLVSVLSDHFLFSTTSSISICPADLGNNTRGTVTWYVLDLPAFVTVDRMANGTVVSRSSPKRGLSCFAGILTVTRLFSSWLKLPKGSSS